MRDATIIVLVICLAAAIPEMLGGIADAVKRRVKKRGNTHDRSDEGETP